MVEGFFGPIVFGKAAHRIQTFHEVTRQYKGRFGAHMVHLRKPLLEWAGNDLIKIDMKVNLNASWCGEPNTLLALWHYLHENAMAAPLIIGGRPMGTGMSLFVITEMAENHKHWLSGGRLIAVEIDAHFEEYIPTAALGGVGSLLQGIPGFGGLF